MINKFMKNKGFTLFELLVSISIIGILIAIASVSFSAAQKKARDARRKEDLLNVQKAAEQYYSLNNYNYPTSYGVGQSWAVNGQTMLESFPTDPKNVAPYQYNGNVGTSGYCFCAALENNTGNCGNSSCTAFTNIGGTGAYFCVKNQQ